MQWIVSEKLAEWQVYYNIDPNSDNYITEEGMKECIEYIIKKVITEMTPVQRDVLSVGYPMDTQEDMINSIKDRAKIAVLDYSIRQNAPQDNNEVIGNINAF